MVPAFASHRSMRNRKLVFVFSPRGRGAIRLTDEPV
jgi:hypothetical protein